jgi:hypothetical protein
MKITSESIVNDAQRLKRTQDEARSRRADDGARPSQQIEVSLDQMSVSLKTHQQSIARIQLESIGLEQIERNLDFLIANNPGDFEDIKRAMNEITGSVDATRFQQQELIPRDIREALQALVSDRSQAGQTRDSVSARRNELGEILQREINQVNRIQVSLENVLSLNMPENSRIRPLIDDIKTQLANQAGFRSSLDPVTVMGLLRDG